ncbi:MAG: hypothetical protein WD534_16250 [Phycisphaeraceae bacterium]
MTVDNDICLNITFTPAVPLKARHQLEESLEAVFEAEELGEVDGGGGFVDGSECNIYLYVADVTKALPAIRQVLQSAKVPESTVIKQEDPEEVVHPVYA